MNAAAASRPARRRQPSPLQLAIGFVTNFFATIVSDCVSARPRPPPAAEDKRNESDDDEERGPDGHFAVKTTSAPPKGCCLSTDLNRRMIGPPTVRRS